MIKIFSMVLCLYNYTYTSKKKIHYRQAYFPGYVKAIDINQDTGYKSYVVDFYWSVHRLGLNPEYNPEVKSVDAIYCKLLDK